MKFFKLFKLFFFKKVNSVFRKIWLSLLVTFQLAHHGNVLFISDRDSFIQVWNLLNWKQIWKTNFFLENWLQILLSLPSGHFRQFDYGNTQLNMKVYGSPFPPKYSLENVTTPVALFSSANDWLAMPPVKIYFHQILFPKIIMKYKKSNIYIKNF